MKVVVYFRVPEAQTGRPAHRFVTCWIENENEVPVASFSQVEAEGTAVSQELAAQYASVNKWLEENQAIVVAEFTEIEAGGKSRPHYGAARKAATTARAGLLIATTKAIHGQRFDPISQDGLTVISLEDPGETERRRWSKSNDIVVYLRTPSDAPEASEWLQKQRTALDKMVHPGIHSVLGEFQEHEVGPTDQPERPELEQALRLCRESHARLFIGTTDAFNASGEFEPAFEDVPFEVAYRKAYEWPETIAVGGSPYPVALYFGSPTVRGHIPVYITNTTGGRLLDVTVSSFGSAAFNGKQIETTPAVKKLGSIQNGDGRLLEGYDIHFDGDFITSYMVTAANQAGHQYAGIAHISEPPTRNWVRVEHWAPAGA